MPAHYRLRKGLKHKGLPPGAVVELTGYAERFYGDKFEKVSRSVPVTHTADGKPLQELPLLREREPVQAKPSAPPPPEPKKEPEVKAPATLSSPSPKPPVVPSKTEAPSPDEKADTSPASTKSSAAGSDSK